MVGEVYAVKLYYLTKYLGYSKRNINILVERSLLGDDNNNHYKSILDELDPFHIVRFLMTKEGPIVYTLATKKEVAKDRFMDVLDILFKSQENANIREKYDSKLFYNMLETNTKPTKLIEWVNDYTEEDFSNKEYYSFQELEGIPEVPDTTTEY